MTLGFLVNCFLQCCFIKIVTAQMPATKYIQMGSMAPVRPTVPTLPSVSMPYTANPTLSSLINNYIPNLPYSNLPLPFNLPNAPPIMPMSSPQMNLPLPFTNVPPVMPLSPSMNLAVPSSNLKPTPPSSFIDPTVMNNLAIALHLLILNNLLHPEQEASKTNVPTEPKTPPSYPQNPPHPQEAAPSSPYPQNYYPEPQETAPYAPPNSKFLGSSGFAEPPLPSLMGAPMPLGSRSHHCLMSPYEVLTSGPQPGKDVFAQYGPQNLKADFQSPYNSLMAIDNTSKDLFSMF
ncbi:uncharacterized protein LOC134752858 [Cydia strobilella]|uniref:uncharacterized protein LOC134752858 n=1 Tax=Cydia strobilella TaxID=1100964 RepID=UPI003006DCEF